MQRLTSRTYYHVPTFETLRQMIYRSVRRYPREDVYLFKRKPNAETESVSYLRFAGHIEALGTSLLRRGFAGERFAIIGENSYTWILAHCTILSGLGLSVPLDRLLPEGEMLELLKRAKPAVFFYASAFHKTLAAHRDELSFIRLFVEMDEAMTLPFALPEGEDLCRRKRRLRQLWKRECLTDSVCERGKSLQQLRGARGGETRGESFVYLSDLLEEGVALRQQGDRAFLDQKIEAATPASLLFTSGTTSLSKAVLLSHRNICSEIAGVAGMVKWKPGVRSLSLLPLHHTFENTCGCLMIIFYAGTICGCNGLRYIQKNMQDFGIDIIIGVPLIFASFYRRIQTTLRKEKAEARLAKGQRYAAMLESCGLKLRRLIFRRILAAFGGNFRYGICGAAPIEAEIIRFFKSIGVEILQGYGLTETSPVSAGCNHRVFVPGTVGHAIANGEVAVDCGQNGEDGEILIRGGHVMEGYLRDDGTLDRSSIDADGWFHSGDMGHIDEHGCLVITGRVKSMIVLPNGKKVFPEELEQLLNNSPMVKASMVWGEDQDGDVCVSAKLVLEGEPLRENGEAASEESIRSRLDKLIAEVNRRIPHFKFIKYYVYGFQDMISTTTMKTKRHLEQERIHKQIGSLQKTMREVSGQNLDRLGSERADALPEKGGEEAGEEPGETAAGRSGQSKGPGERGEDQA